MGANSTATQQQKDAQQSEVAAQAPPKTPPPKKLPEAKLGTEDNATANKQPKDVQQAEIAGQKQTSEGQTGPFPNIPLQDRFQSAWEPPARAMDITTVKELLGICAIAERPRMRTQALLDEEDVTCLSDISILSCKFWDRLPELVAWRMRQVLAIQETPGGLTDASAT